jgi:hypothetical protein
LAIIKNGGPLKFSSERNHRLNSANGPDYQAFQPGYLLHEVSSLVIGAITFSLIKTTHPPPYRRRKRSK